MLNRLLDFTHALRKAGVPVAASENIDALKALGHVPFDDKDAFKAALATTMVKSDAHRPAFETIFDLYFGAAPTPEATDARDADNPEGDPEEYLEELYRALLSGDASGLRDMARRAVAAFGRVDMPQGGSPYFQYRVFRVVDLDLMMRRLMEELSGREDLTALERQLWKDEFEARVKAFRAEVDAEVRRRLAEHRGPEAVARHA
ncbi:MAG: hypothetical protein WAT66_12780, partial [Actinomycetota bacterium]